MQVAELTEEQKEYIAKMQAEKEAAASAEDVEAKGPTSFFHGKAEKDYQVQTTTCRRASCNSSAQY